MQVPEHTLKNIENSFTNHRNCQTMNEKVLSVILGGGVGSRLYPLTADRSKPAVPIAGKYRLIDIPISNCLNSGLKRMFVLTQFNSASLNRHLKNSYQFDRFADAFVDILAAEQTPHNQSWFQGTADAVRQIIPHLEALTYEYVLILSGDHLYQMDYASMIQHHIDSGADVTVGTIPVVESDCPGFGVMKVNEEGSISSFIEKPAPEVVPEWTSPVSEEMKAQGRNYLASMGIYVFSKNVLLDLLQSSPDSIDFGKEIIPAAVESTLSVTSFSFTGYWTDIGTIRTFFEANLRLTTFLPEFNLYNNSEQLYTRARMLAPCKIFGTRFNHSLLSEGCISHAESVDNAIIGIRSRIGKRTVIKNAIIMGIDYYQALMDITDNHDRLLGIGEDCYLENVIIDKNVKIGNGVRIVGSLEMEDTETDHYCVREGIVIVKKGAKIPDGLVVG